MPDTDSNFRKAMRWNDAIAEEHGFLGALEQLEIDAAEIMHVSRQAAMRARLVQTGRLAELQAMTAANTPREIAFSVEDEEAMVFLQSYAINCICIGYRAANEGDQDA